MRNIKVKICGLKNENDVRLCMRLGIDILGFVTGYPLPVPWNLTQAEASALIKLIAPEQKSSIITGGTPEKVIRLACELRPSFVQLHYKETLEDTIIIANALKKLDIGVIKTIPPVKEDRMAQFGTANVETVVKKLCKTNIFALLADSRVPDNSFKKGTSLDLEFCSQIIRLSNKPVIIAGGIHADNVCSIVRKTKAEFIDIMTGVEKAPGQKDPQLLSRLLSNVRNNKTI
ncbi:MAG: phosphoribosylanthranilate isomerase [Clostridiaceae bacterium]|jgi:phosphoribosylanthranilate isomerase|nr:phosphoribosylanthranilate isomerase [Clostridiaceae bacterium]